MRKMEIYCSEDKPTILATNSIAADSMSRKKEIQMNGNSKKMTVFLSVTAIAIFGVMAMASAGDRDDNHGGIIGEYAIVGSGACLFGVGGLDPIHFTPASATGSSVGPNTWEGVYRFYRDGHGEFDSLNRFADTTPSAGLARVSWNFKYKKEEQGRIIFYDIGSYLGNYLYGPLACTPFSTLTGVSFSPNSYEGLISPDGNTLLVSFGVPMKLIPPFPGLEIACNGVQQGFKCWGKCPDLVIPTAPTCP
jgi:hypothetical protein